MLIKESFRDVETSGGTTMRIFVYHPNIPQFPQAKFPGVIVYSEIYQVTGPVARFARQIASQGYICVAPSIYHDFEGPEPLDYDGPGTDKGNDYKIQKTVASYDEDNKLTVDYLRSLKTCTGRIGATGMCLGGHLAYRAALDKRVIAATCFFATDIHSHSLGRNKADNSLVRSAEIKGELALIFGKLDPHVPPAGRDLIRKTLEDNKVRFGFYEFPWAQHAFVRDEFSKGRYDAAITKVGLEILFELFGRTLKVDLGVEGEAEEVEDVC